MILGERWESILDDSRIEDPTIGADIVSMHETITVEMLEHLGCWVDRTLLTEGWVSVCMPDYGDRKSSPVWMPTYTMTLPFPRIEGTIAASEEERAAFDTGGNDRLREYREMVRRGEAELFEMRQPRETQH